MANTRASLGEQATLDGLVSRTLTSLEEDGVTKLRNYALYGNTVLQEVNFPNLTDTGQYAFQDCTALESAELPQASIINNYAFSGCRLLKTFNMPNVITLNQYAFQNCSAMNSDSINLSNVKTIGNYVFANSGVGKLVLPVCTSLGNYTGQGSRMGVIDITNNISIASNKFANAYGLCHLILRSSTMCSMGSTNALNNTGIANSRGWIYVPSDLVDTYKAATNWSTYADRIVSIDEYPKAIQNETITDTWAQIAAAESDGTYSSKYSVGDIKYVDIGGTQVAMQIVAMDSDTLADNSGKAKITWISLGFIDLYWMNPTATTEGGWKDCAMRAFLRDVIYAQIESDCKNIIKNVTKTYRDYSSSSTKTVTDSVWIPSYREVFGGTSYENDGVDYTSVFTDATSRIKQYGLSNAARIWWLRSAYSSTSFWGVNSSGGEYSGNAIYSYGVVLGFCT